MTFRNKNDSVLTLVSWNVNSWTYCNSNLRQNVLKYVEPDVIIIVETKLKHAETINLDGFKWYGFNRKSQLKTAKCGSGGVGFFISYKLLEYMEVTVIDINIDGLYIISLESKSDDCRFIMCACYLSPETSSWGSETVILIILHL